MKLVSFGYSVDWGTKAELDSWFESTEEPYMHVSRQRRACFYELATTGDKEFKAKMEGSDEDPFSLCMYFLSCATPENVIDEMNSLLDNIKVRLLHKVLIPTYNIALNGWRGTNGLVPSKNEEPKEDSIFTGNVSAVGVRVTVSQQYKEIPKLFYLLGVTLRNTYWYEHVAHNVDRSVEIVNQYYRGEGALETHIEKTTGYGGHGTCKNHITLADWALIDFPEFINPILRGMGRSSQDAAFTRLSELRSKL